MRPFLSRQRVTGACARARAPRAWGTGPTAGRLRSAAAVAASTALVAVLIVSGCATHAQQRAAMERAMAGGDYAAALAELEKNNKDPQDVLYLLDRGLLLHYLERFDESNEAFETAEIRIQDLYTRSVSKEAASLVTSDVAIPYDGAPFERVLLHYYRTLNYVHGGDVEGALVECRKANLLLAGIADATEGKGTAYKDDAFLQHLTALLYEDAGEWNDAWVSLRLAEEAFGRYEATFGVSPPAFLGSDLRRLARGLGYREEYEQYRERYTDAADSVGDGGEVVFLFENGLAPAKGQQDLVLPILKDDDDHYQDRDAWALAVANRYQGFSYDDADLEYLLRVAIPKLEPRPSRVRSAEIEVGGRVARTVIVEDVAALSSTALSEAMPRILLKTVLRGITKYAATRLAKDKAGEVGGFLANILTAATERADTRGWITLPGDIQMARVAVQPGDHAVTLRFLDAGGTVVAAEDAGTVRVDPGRRVYVSWRRWD